MTSQRGQHQQPVNGRKKATMADNYGKNSEMNINLYLEPDQIKLSAMVAEHVLDGPDSVDKFAKELNIPVERLSAMYEALYLFLHGDGLEAVKGKGWDQCRATGGKRGGE